MSRRTMRTFIAVGLDDAVRQRTVALQRQLAHASTAVKWVEPENLHFTLLFLGEVEARELLDVCRVVSRAAATIEPFELEVVGVGGFPNLRRPRTLWLGAGEGALQMVALHDALEAPLLDLGAYRREDRGFTPHVTLGRLKTDDATDELRAELAKQAAWPGGRQAVTEVRVMTSELTREGPEYTVVGRGRLGG
jgi:2'-5' RNA ligase